MKYEVYSMLQNTKNRKITQCLYTLIWLVVSIIFLWIVVKTAANPFSIIVLAYSIGKIVWHSIEYGNSIGVAAILEAYIKDQLYINETPSDKLNRSLNHMEYEVKYEKELHREDRDKLCRDAYSHLDTGL